MGRVIGNDAECYISRPHLANRYLGFLLFLLLINGAETASAKKTERALNYAARDPRQLVMMVADFDGTLARNVGHFRLKRASQIEAISPFFTGVSALPEEIAVPVYDYEGNLGPQVAKRIGRLDERGRFIPSTSLDVITLSDGQKIIPGYYYFDLQSSFREFRPPNPGEEGYLLTAVNEKLAKKERFLMDAFPLFSLSMSDEFVDRVNGSILTMRGHQEAEMKSVFDTLQKKLKLGKRDFPLEAFANLANPSFYEFGFSKTNYLYRLYNELTDRQMSSMAVPHFLVMFENDLDMLRDIDALFQRLSNQGVFANPVVPVLVNLVEQEVLDQPDGHNWRWSPMREIKKMSRVTVYWPGDIERSNEYSRVLELTLGMSKADAEKRIQKVADNRFQCGSEVAGGGK